MSGFLFWLAAGIGFLESVGTQLSSYRTMSTSISNPSIYRSIKILIINLKTAISPPKNSIWTVRNPISIIDL